MNKEKIIKIMTVVLVLLMVGCGVKKNNNNNSGLLLLLLLNDIEMKKPTITYNNQSGDYAYFGLRKDNYCYTEPWDALAEMKTNVVTSPYKFSAGDRYICLCDKFGYRKVSTKIYNLKSEKDYLVKLTYMDYYSASFTFNEISRSVNGSMYDLEANNNDSFSVVYEFAQAQK